MYYRIFFVGAASVASAVSFPAPRKCAERFIVAHGGNRSTIVDPLAAYQLRLSPLREELLVLNTSRFRAISELGQMSASIPCKANKAKMCTALKGKEHADLSLRLGARRPVLFYRDFECDEPAAGDPCKQISRGSFGNTFGYYWVARAGAKAASADFVSLRDLHACPDEISAWLPTVAASEKTPTKNTYELAAKTVCADKKNFVHLSSAWLAAVPEASVEIRESLRAWARFRNFRDIDDVAVHFRCGDTLAQGHGQYGLLPFAALADIVPENVNVTVGIVTQPFEHYCGGGGSASDLAEAATAHGATSCACQCKYIVQSLVETLGELRPLARVSVHSNDLLIAAWTRLALAPVASVCQSSTFCLWPTIAASKKGYLTSSPLFPHAAQLAKMLPHLNVVPGLVPYNRIASRKVRKGCGTSLPELRRKAAQLLFPSPKQKRKQSAI